MRKVIDLYKGLTSGAKLLPTSTSFSWWESSYTANGAALDREFTRRYRNFKYYDFLEDKDTTLAESIADFKNDVLSILTLNQKKYAELYRIYTISDDDLPIAYNYDMTETTGKQHTETKYGEHETEYGAHEFEYGATQDTKGSQDNTYGATTDSHNVAPFNSATPVIESQDTTAQYINTEGQRIDSSIAHTDTDKAHTDTDKEHTDEYDADEWTLTRKGNIGVQTGADIARIFENFWINNKFMLLIFEDICKQLLLIGDDYGIHC